MGTTTDGGYKNDGTFAQRSDAQPSRPKETVVDEKIFSRRIDGWNKQQ